MNITVKTHLPTIITQYWTPTRKYVNWINVGNGYMKKYGWHPYCYSNTLYESLHHGFPFSIKLSNAKYWANLSPSFAFIEGVISSLKWPAAILSTIKKNADGNEHNG